MTNSRYIRKLLAEAANSIGIADVLRYLELSMAGGDHARIGRRLKHFGIDTSRLLGQAHTRGRRLSRRPAEKVLVVMPPGSDRQKPTKLRGALEKVGVPYRCAGCRMDGAWLGQPLTLHIDHINGDRRDNRKENLRFLCPNRRSRTENFAGKGKGVVAQLA